MQKPRKVTEKVQENEGIIQNEIFGSCCNRVGGEVLGRIIVLE